MPMTTSITHENADVPPSMNPGAHRYGKAERLDERFAAILQQASRNRSQGRDSRKLVQTPRFTCGGYFIFMSNATTSAMANSGTKMTQPDIVQPMVAAATPKMADPRNCPTFCPKLRNAWDTGAS